MEEMRAEQDQLHSVITIMQEKINGTPKLLNLTAGRESCCIFRVPQTLVEVNKKAYHPQILSIGPYHHGKPHLNMIEEHKWKYLGELLRRTPPNGLNLDGYINVIAPLETRIRDSYSEAIPFERFDFIKMMVLDGLFILELMSKAERVAPVDPDDPIFKLGWILFSVTRDLLQLENQIPFFVLQTLFDNTGVTRSGGGDQTLAELIFGFFSNTSFGEPNEVLEGFENHEWKHLLDFFRLRCIPVQANNPIARSRRELGENDNTLFQLISSAKILNNTAGIKFKAKKGDTFSFLEISFCKGVLEIPQISIDDFITGFLLNSVAFEQCYRYRSRHMTAYASFMGCLVKNPSDAVFLTDRKILENYFGTDKELARFFNDLQKEATINIENSYLWKVFAEVNEYQRNGFHVHWAGFKNTYFNTPWSFISALAALILLLLTMIQVFFAVYPFAGGKSPGGK